MTSSVTGGRHQMVPIEEFRELQHQFKKLLEKQSCKPTSTKRFIIEKDPPPSEHTSLKPTKLPEFIGIRAEYPAWRAAVLDTFRMDWNLFGYDNSRAFLMIYNALKGTARTKASSFYEAGGVRNTRDPEDFIEFLDRLFLDSTRISRAKTELQSMKMEDKQHWSDFLASWSNKLTEARGDFWPDDNKISLLQNALNKKLTMALASNHMLPDDDFNEWVNIVNRVAQQFEIAESRFYGRRDYTYPDANLWHGNRDKGRTIGNNGINWLPHNQISDNFDSRFSNLGKDGAVDESGDTVMGGVNAMGVVKDERRRAMWKTKSQLEILRQEGRCFRCERKGCITRKCPLLPALKPRGNSVRVTSTSLPEIDPSMYYVEEVEVESEN